MRAFARVGALVAAVALVAVPAATAGTIDVQVLAFNDFHGNLEPPSGGGGVIRTSNDPVTSVPAGGAEYFSTHMKALEAENPERTFVVSAGDLIGASPLLSALFHDEPTIEVMNEIGLDFNGVGNHEFDEGKDELLRMQYGGCHPVDGCQDETPFYGSLFMFLAANVIDNSLDDPLLPEFEVEKVRVGPDHFVKIAFIGETLEATPEIVTPAGVQGLTFLDEADTVNRLIPRLKERGVEAIVLLLHQGGFQRSPFLYDTCNRLGGDILDVVGRLDPEVDVVVSGHTHQPYLCDIDGRLVTSASSFGRLITDIDLTLDTETGEVAARTARNVIVTRDVAPDPAITALIDHYRAFADPIADRVVGSVTADITRAENFARESALGDVIADAQLAATAPSDFGGSVVAFMNDGGIRADITYDKISGTEQPGEVTYGELFEVQPFGNTLVVKTCTGAQIDALLEQQWSVTSTGERERVLQVSDGFTYSYDASLPLGSRIDIASIKINGVPVVADQGYRVTMNSFLATGGSGFSVFTQCTNALGGEVDLDALVRYFLERSPIAPGPQNRITRIG